MSTTHTKDGVTVGFRAQAELRDKLQQRAVAEDRSVSSVIRQAVRSYLGSENR